MVLNTIDQKLSDIFSNLDYFEDVINFNLNLGFLYKPTAVLFYETQVTNTTPLSGFSISPNTTDQWKVYSSERPMWYSYAHPTQCPRVTPGGDSNLGIDIVNSIELVGNVRNRFRHTITLSSLNNKEQIRLFLTPQNRTSPDYKVYFRSAKHFAEPRLLDNHIEAFLEEPAENWADSHELGTASSKIDTNLTKKDFFMGFLTSVIMVTGDTIERVQKDIKELYTPILDKDQIYITSPISFKKQLVIRSDVKHILDKSEYVISQIGLQESDIIKNNILFGEQLEQINSFCAELRMVSQENGTIITTSYAPVLPYEVRRKNKDGDKLHFDSMPTLCRYICNPQLGVQKPSSQNVELSWVYVLADKEGFGKIKHVLNRDVLMYDKLNEQTFITIRIINRSRDTLFAFDVPLSIINNVDEIHGVITAAFENTRIQINDDIVYGFEIDAFSGLVGEGKQIINANNLNI